MYRRGHGRELSRHTLVLDTYKRWGGYDCKSVNLDSECELTDLERELSILLPGLHRFGNMLPMLCLVLRPLRYGCLILHGGYCSQ